MFLQVKHKLSCARQKKNKIRYLDYHFIRMEIIKFNQIFSVNS